MAKRVADTYLTDQNWDKELPEQEVKDFVLFRNLIVSVYAVCLSQQTGISGFWS